MATLREIIDALDTFIESAEGLGLTCIKGYPDFARANLQPPIAALFYGGSSEQAQAAGVRKRVGASTTAVIVSLGVYAANEVQLFELAFKLQAIRQRRPVLNVGSGSQEVKVYLGDDERTPPDEEATKEERHLVTCPVVLAVETAWTERNFSQLDFEDELYNSAYLAVI
jgi:hypothetical protein